MAEQTQNLNTPKTRVLIAKDVLSLMAAGRITADSTYFSPSGRLRAGSDLRSELQAIPNCEVCGIGACFYAMVKRFNGVTVREDQWGEGEVPVEDIRAKLSEAFSNSQISLIECAFERDECFADAGLDWSEVDTAVEFGDGFTEDENRMVAIMQNIIENNGEFRP